MSSLSEAVMSGVIASMDPTVAMQRDAITGFVDQQRSHLLETKAKAVENIGALLHKAISEGQDQVIITSYQKLLAQLTS